MIARNYHTPEEQVKTIVLEALRKASGNPDISDDVILVTAKGSETHIEFIENEAFNTVSIAMAVKYAADTIGGFGRNMVVDNPIGDAKAVLFGGIAALTDGRFEQAFSQTVPNHLPSHPPSHGRY